MQQSYNVDFGRPRGAKCRFRMLFGRVWKNTKNHEFLKLEQFGKKLKQIEIWSSKGGGNRKFGNPGGMCGRAGLWNFTRSLVLFDTPAAPRSGGGGLKRAVRTPRGRNESDLASWLIEVGE